MCRIWLTTYVALCSCVGSMVRAPKQIPPDGVVECTDSMETPIEAAAVGVVSTGVALYAGTHPQDASDSGGIFWGPVLAVAGVTLLLSAAVGASHARECRAAKQRGAEAETKSKQADAAARADDCATVRELTRCLFGTR